MPYIHFHESLQQRLVRDPSLTVEKAIESCRAAEMSKIQQKSLKPRLSKIKVRQQKKKEDSQQSYDCKKCGSHHKRASCPAFGNVWKNESLCNRMLKHHVKTQELDTEANCNIIPWTIFKNLEFKKQPHWISTLTIVVSYTNDKFDVESMPILGLNTCVKLKLIKKEDIDIRVCNTITEEINMSKQEFIAANEKIFQGLGSYPYKYEIKLKEHAVPVVSPCRRVSFSIKDRLKSTLDSLEGAGIIKKVNYTTDWVNNMVIIEKPNKTLRICLDPRQHNKSIKPEKFPIPTADELCNRLAGKEVYSVLDMKDGFDQVKLTEKSSEVCTFITPFGKYKYTRLSFDLSTAPKVFQRVNTIIFGDIEDVGIYFDDLIIVAKNGKDHDKIMQLVLERANKYNVRFNKNKLQYKTNEVKYLGFIFNKDGVKPDRSHVEAILKLKQPTNKKELLRILDLLSRSHLNKDETEVANNTDNEIVHSLNTYVAMSQSRVAEFQKATANDTKLKQIINYSLNDWPQARSTSGCDKSYHIKKSPNSVVHMYNEYDSEEESLSSSDSVTVRPSGVNEGRALVTTKSGRVVRKPSRPGIA
uniref:uncharacterized protein K02A2.6-like n=1 Tax=Osmia lignaria TaxID=473952 RepID=UPI0014782C81|nr:uncharacterized protein K02A2.6-like [Osmia lignaria]